MICTKVTTALTSVDQHVVKSTSSVMGAKSKASGGTRTPNLMIPDSY